MNISRFLLLNSLLFLAFTSCAPKTDTSVIFTPSPTSSIPAITATTVPPTPTFQATSTPQVTAVPTTPAIPEVNTAVFTQIAQFTYGTINDIKWSPDGATFAVASSTGVQLYSNASAFPTQILETQAVVNSVYFIPQTDLLALLICQEITCHPEIWATASAQMVKSLPTYLGMSPVFPDGHFIAVEQLDFETIKLHWLNAEAEETGQTVTLSHFPLAFSPDDSTLVISISETELGIISTNDGALLASLSAPGGTLSTAYSADGTLLAVGNGDGQTRLWRVAGGELVHTLDGSYGLAFSPDGRLLAASGDQSTIRLWDTATGQLLDTQKGGSRLAFSPDGSELAVANTNSVSFFPVTNFELHRNLADYGNPIEGVAISPDGLTLAAVTSQEVQLWDIPSRKLHETIIFATTFTAAAFSPDGQFLALAGIPPSSLRIWHLENHDLAGELKGETSYVNSLAYSPDGRLIATAVGDQIIKLWDTVTLELLFSTSGAQFAFSPDGRFLATSDLANADSGEWQVQIWSPTTFELLHTLTQVGPQIAFGADGHLLAVQCCVDVGVWDVETGQLVRLLPGIRAIGAVSPNNLLLVHPDYANAIAVWNLDSGQHLVNLDGHTAGFSDRGAACCLVFSPDGRFFASGSWDGTVRLWGIDVELGDFTVVPNP